MTVMVSLIRFRPAKPLDVAQGLLGLATITLGEAVTIHSVAVRRTRGGRHVISFPAPKGRDGQRRPVAHPTDAETHAEIERQVIEQLHRDGHLEPAEVRHAE